MKKVCRPSVYLNLVFSGHYLGHCSHRNGPRVSNSGVNLYNIPNLVCNFTGEELFRIADEIRKRYVRESTAFTAIAIAVSMLRRALGLGDPR